MNPQPSTSKANSGTNLHDISAITVTRIESFDPLTVIEEATAQAAAERMAREHADPANPKALTHHFEKNDEYDSCFIDLVIEGSDQTRLDIVLRRLQARGHELAVRYAESDE